MLTNIASGARGQSEIAVLSGWAKFTQKKSSRRAVPLPHAARSRSSREKRTAGLNARRSPTIYVESGP